MIMVSIQNIESKQRNEWLTNVILVIGYYSEELLTNRIITAVQHRFSDAVFILRIGS